MNLSNKQLDPSFTEGFILHSKSFKESSLICSFLSKEQGIISILAKGAKRNKSKFRGLLQPFNNLLISYKGKSDLLTLTHAEFSGKRLDLSGQALLSGIYLNELLIKLLDKQAPNLQLYQSYYNCLAILSAEPHNIAVLRYFERELLDIMGYGINFHVDHYSNKPIEPELDYIFNPYEGFYKFEENKLGNNIVVKGNSIIALRDNDLSDKNDFIEAKKILRFALMLHLKSALESKMFYSRRK